MRGVFSRRSECIVQTLLLIFRASIARGPRVVHMHWILIKKLDRTSDVFLAKRIATTLITSNFSVRIK